MKEYQNLRIVELKGKMISLDMRTLKNIDKHYLIQIILLRESFFFDKLNKFQDSLKSNDREVFKNLLKDNERVHEYLKDKSKSYYELQKRKKENHKIKAFSVLKKQENEGLKIQISILKKQINELEKVLL